jgi:hypothetical protein
MLLLYEIHLLKNIVGVIIVINEEKKKSNIKKKIRKKEIELTDKEERGRK